MESQTPYVGQLENFHLHFVIFWVLLLHVSIYYMIWTVWVSSALLEKVLSLLPFGSAFCITFILAFEKQALGKEPVKLGECFMLVEPTFEVFLLTLWKHSRPLTCLIFCKKLKLQSAVKLLEVLILEIR